MGRGNWRDSPAVREIIAEQERRLKAIRSLIRQSNAERHLTLAQVIYDFIGFGVIANPATRGRK